MHLCKQLSVKILPVAILVIFNSCKKPQASEYTEYRPVLLDRKSLESSVAFHPPVEIASPAKISFKDNYIFISERFKGIHIINNSNPAHPVNEGYISIPGCIDMAISGNTLYADNAVDLIALDLRSLTTESSVRITKRIENAFPEIPTPDGKPLPDKYRVENRPVNTVLIEWKK